MSTTTIVLIFVADLVLVAYAGAKFFGRVSEVKAKALLKSGAKLVDVRSPEEFGAGHVARAVNLPYQEVGQRIAALAPDKSAPLLVYCLSGGRSGIARNVLRGQGYAQVYNLGSLRRAKQIVEG